MENEKYLREGIKNEKYLKEGKENAFLTKEPSTSFCFEASQVHISTPAELANLQAWARASRENKKGGGEEPPP